MTSLQILEADLNNAEDQAVVLGMTRAYARDPMGNGRDLPEEVAEQLVEALQAHPTTIIFLALRADQPVGIVTCFVGFSTFAARPLINIHDLYVTGDCRRTAPVRCSRPSSRRHASWDAAS